MITSRPVIIHISGSPGSGKTTLGNWIVEHLDFIAVKDTDEFIQRGDEEDRRLEGFREDEEKYMNELSALKSRKIEDFILENQDKDIVVFVGLMDHFGLKKFYDFKQANLKYFIDIEPKLLIKQYYTRLIKVSGEIPQIWEDISNGRDYIMSSTEKIHDDKILAREHIDHGYELKTFQNLQLFFSVIMNHIQFILPEALNTI